VASGNIQRTPGSAAKASASTSRQPSALASVAARTCGTSGRAKRDLASSIGQLRLRRGEFRGACDEQPRQRALRLARATLRCQRAGQRLPPSSTKNQAKARDPEMHQTRKTKNWYFGMKFHIGAAKGGLVHSLATGPANEADITRLEDLLHGQEDELYGDQAYWSEDHRQRCRHAGIRYRVNRRAKPGKKLTGHQKAINRSRSRARAAGEFAFHVVKRLWGFAKVRYRGLYKNTVRAFAAFALANLYLARRGLLPPGARCAL
jgi:IS5 family transposase